MQKIILENTVLALLKAAPGLGSIHIRKGLILIDAYYHSLFGKTLTDVTYVKHDLGPVPDPEANNVLFGMEFGKIAVKPEKKGNYFQKGHWALVDPKYNLLPPKSVEIIREVAHLIKPMTASHLSHITHDEIWASTTKGAVIPIEKMYSLEFLGRKTRKLTHAEKAEVKGTLEGIYNRNELKLSAGNR
ncbi:hypothetical protein EZS27_015677 [termite gut metagenome]|uniref:Antitoxin SocA-like Panacea domain-containing protein n=1 Tax=termite gut metagenome TaxID=433724 RepID=A0A5J4RRN0_9ZZZZ